MAVHLPTLFDLLDRASKDPEFLKRWAADPLETTRAEGVELTSEDLKLLLGVPGATDLELVHVLRGRLRAIESGCGCSFSSCTP